MPVKQNLYSVKIVTYIAGNGKKIRNCPDPRQARGKQYRGLARGSETKRAAGGGASEDAPYHHGALHDACSRQPSGCSNATGLSGLTLRAVAREAGVSHAAPTHHFGDLTGLVSELAAIGFRQFNTAMGLADAAGNSPVEKAMARAKAYVAYAQAHPGMYGLMFRTERLDMTRPSLHEAAGAAFAGLAGRSAPAAMSRSPNSRCRSSRPRPSPAPGRWSMASPCCCSMTACPISFGGRQRARRRKCCWRRC